MEYYNSYHSISEFLKQGKGRLFIDAQRLHNAQRESANKKKSRLLQLVELAKQNSVHVEERSPRELQSLLPALDQSHYRGYILELEQSEDQLSKAESLAEVLLRMPKLVLLLDGVMDIGNLGALVRSSDLFGVGAIFVTHRSAGRSTGRAPQNQLGRASSGASSWVPIIEGNLKQVAQQLQNAGYWLYGADMQGEIAAQTKFQEHCALVLGAEERGLSPQLREQCDELIRIPTEGHIDSLNVSAAGAVLLYEIKRQDSLS